MDKRLDHKLDCKTCGTISLAIPDNASEDTVIVCASCGGFLGSWGELQNDFAKQTRPGPGAFDLRDGQIYEKD